MLKSVKTLSLKMVRELLDGENRLTQFQLVRDKRSRHTVSQKTHKIIFVISSTNVEFFK